MAADQILEVGQNPEVVGQIQDRHGDHVFQEGLPVHQGYRLEEGLSFQSCYQADHATDG